MPGAVVKKPIQPKQAEVDWPTFVGNVFARVRAVRCARFVAREVPCSGAFELVGRTIVRPASATVEFLWASEPKLLVDLLTGE